MLCDVRLCKELLFVVPCNGMEYYEVKSLLYSKQLLCATKYSSSTTLTLLCTLKYYSSITPNYSVLQSTTPDKNFYSHPMCASAPMPSE